MWRNVALVATFIDDDRLSELLAPDSCLPHVQPSSGLDAQVRHPWLRVVIKRKAVVDRAEVLVGIVLLDDAEEAIPVGHGFVLHEIILVGHRPPDIAIGGESGHYIAQEAIIRLGIPSSNATTVVGVEENDI